MFLVKWLTAIANLISEQTLQPTDFYGFVMSIGDCFVWLGNAIANLATGLVYGVCKWLLAFTDFLQYFLQKMIGLDYWLNSPYYTIEGATSEDLLFSFLYNSTVQKTFRALCGVGIVLLIIFTIFSIIRSEWQYISGGDGKGNFGDGNNSKTTIIRNAIKAIALVIVFPMFLIVGIISSDAILASIVKALNIDTASTFGATLFGISTQSANRFRNYAENDARSGITDEITFYIDGDGKYIYLTNDGEVRTSFSHGYNQYDKYLTEVRAAKRAGREYTVHTMFDYVSTGVDFSGYCCSIDVDGTSYYYLVKCGSAEKDAYRYYLKNVLHVPVMTKTENIGNSSLWKSLKPQMNSSGFIGSLNINSYSQGSEVGKAACNTWGYPTIFNQTSEFTNAISYITLSQSETPVSLGSGENLSILNALNLGDVESAKVMFNSDAISAYFDGGQFGIPQLQTEYAVMADIVDFMNENNLQLYMMNVNSPYINWNFDANYHIGSKWIGNINPDGSVGNTDDFPIAQDSQFGEMLKGKIPFIINYSDMISDVDAGNVLYLADGKARNEKEGALYIWCFKVTNSSGNADYVPLVHGRSYHDPLTNKYYNFNTSYYGPGYDGVVLARGLMESSFSNSDDGLPTYIQESLYINPEADDEDKKTIDENASYYYDLQIVGGLAQYAQMASGNVDTDFRVTTFTYSNDGETESNYSISRTNGKNEWQLKGESSLNHDLMKNISITLYLPDMVSVNSRDSETQANSSIDQQSTMANYTGIHDGNYYLFSFNYDKDGNTQECYFPVRVTGNRMSLYSLSGTSSASSTFAKVSDTANSAYTGFTTAGWGYNVKGTTARYKIMATTTNIDQAEGRESIDLNSATAVKDNDNNDRYFNPGDFSYWSTDKKDILFSTSNKINIGGTYTFANVLFNMPVSVAGTDATDAVVKSNFDSSDGDGKDFKLAGIYDNSSSCKIDFANPERRFCVKSTSIQLNFYLYSYYTAAIGAEPGGLPLYEYKLGGSYQTAARPDPKKDAERIISMYINSEFSWDPRGNRYDLYNGKAYVGSIYKNLDVQCGSISSMPKVTQEFLYNQKTYSNVQTRNRFATTNDFTSYYKDLQERFITLFYRDQVGVAFRTYFDIGFIHLYIRLSPFGYKFDRNVRAGNYFKISNGIDFDYFFDGDIKLSTFFVPKKISYWVIVIASILIIKTLSTAIWGVIKRFYEITLYFLAMPVMASTIPLESSGGGSRFTEAIQRPLIQKVLSTYGVIIGINVFFILLTPIKSIASSVFTDADIATSGSYFLIKLHFSAKVLNNFVYILFMLVAFTMIDALPGMVSKMIGGGDDSNVVKSGQAAKDTAKKQMKSVGDTMTGAGVVKAWDGAKSMAKNSLIGRGIKAIGAGTKKVKDNFEKGSKEAEQDGTGASTTENQTTTSQQKVEEGAEGGGEGGGSTEGAAPKGPSAAETGGVTAEQANAEGATEMQKAAYETQQEMDGADPQSVESSYNQDNGFNAQGEEAEGDDAGGASEAEAATTVRSMSTDKDEAQQGLANKIAAKVVQDQATASGKTTEDVLNGKKGLMSDVSNAAKIEAIRSTLTGAEREKFDKQFMSADGKPLQGKDLEKAQEKALKNYSVEASVDDKGNLNYSVSHLDAKGNKTGDAQAVTGAAAQKITSEILSSDKVGDKAIVTATKELGENAVSQVKKTAGENLVLAAGSALTGNLNDSIVNKVEEDAAKDKDGNSTASQIRGEALLKTLEKGSTAPDLENFLAANGFGNHEQIQAALADPEKRKSIGKLLNKTMQEDGNEHIKGLIQKNDEAYKQNVLSVAKDQAAEGNFKVTAWDLATDEQRQAYTQKKQAEIDAKKTTSVLDGASEEEKESIISSTTRSILTDEGMKNGPLAKNLANAVFAQNVTQEELKNLSPERLKALTGKTKVEDLTAEDIAFIGFVKKNQEGNTLDNFDTTDKNAVSALRGQFETDADARLKTLDQFSSKEISDAVQTNETLTGLVGGIATKLSDVALSSEQKTDLATTTALEVKENAPDKAELAKTVTEEDLSNLTPERLKAITGKDKVEDLTDEDKALIGFVKQENGGKIPTELRNIAEIKNKYGRLTDQNYMNSVQNAIFASSVTAEALQGINDPAQLVAKLTGNREGATIDNLTDEEKAKLGFAIKSGMDLNALDIADLDSKFKNNAERKNIVSQYKTQEISDAVASNDSVQDLIIGRIDSSRIRAQLNGSYDANRAQIERAKKLDENSHESAALIATDSARQVIAFTNSEIDQKGTITDDAIKAAFGIDSPAKVAEGLAAITGDGEGQISAEEIKKLKANGMSEEAILIAYKKAELAGKLVDKDGKALSSGAIAGVLATASDDDEINKLAIQKLYEDGTSVDASPEASQRFVKAQQAILGALTDDQKKGLGEVSALTEKETDELKVLSVKQDEKAMTDVKVAKLVKDTEVDQENIRAIAEKNGDYQAQFKAKFGKDFSEATDDEKNKFFADFSANKNNTSKMREFEKTAKENKILAQELGMSEDEVAGLSGISRGLALKRALRHHEEGGDVINVTDEEILGLLEDPNNAKLAENIEGRIADIPFSFAQRMLYGDSGSGKVGQAYAQERAEEIEMVAAGMAASDERVAQQVLDYKVEQTVDQGQFMKEARSTLQNNEQFAAFMKAKGKSGRDADAKHASEEDIREFLKTAGGAEAKTAIYRNLKVSTDDITAEDVKAFYTREDATQEEKEAYEVYRLRAKGAIQERDLSENTEITDEERYAEAQKIIDYRQKVQDSKADKEKREKEALDSINLEGTDAEKEVRKTLESAVENEDSDVGKVIRDFNGANKDGYKSEANLKKIEGYDAEFVQNLKNNKKFVKDYEKKYGKGSFEKASDKDINDFFVSLDTKDQEKIKKKFNESFAEAHKTQAMVQFYQDNKNNADAQSNYMVSQVVNGSALGKEIDAFYSINGQDDINDVLNLTPEELAKKKVEFYNNNFNKKAGNTDAAQVEAMLDIQNGTDKGHRMQAYSTLFSKEYKEFAKNYKNTAGHGDATEAEIQSQFYLKNKDQHIADEQTIADIANLNEGTETGKNIDAFIDANKSDYKRFKKVHKDDLKGLDENAIKAKFVAESREKLKNASDGETYDEFLTSYVKDNVDKEDVQAFAARDAKAYENFATEYESTHSGASSEEIMNAYYAKNIHTANPKAETKALNAFYATHPERLKGYTEDYVKKNVDKSTLKNYAELDENKDAYAQFAEEYTKNHNGAEDQDIQAAFYASRVEVANPEMAKEIKSSFYSRGSQSYEEFVKHSLTSKKELTPNINKFAEKNKDEYSKFADEYLQNNTNWSVTDDKRNSEQYKSHVADLVNAKIKSGELNIEDVYSQIDVDDENYKKFAKGYEAKHKNAKVEDIKKAYYMNNITQFEDEISKEIAGKADRMYYAENDNDVKSAFYAKNIAKADKNLDKKLKKDFYEKNKNEKLEEFVQLNQDSYEEFAKQYKKANGKNVDERTIKAEFFAQYSRNMSGLIDETQSKIGTGGVSLKSGNIFGSVDEVAARELETKYSQDFELIAAKNSGLIAGSENMSYTDFAKAYKEAKDKGQISADDVTAIQQKAKKLKYVSNFNGLDTGNAEGLAEINKLAGGDVDTAYSNLFGTELSSEANMHNVLGSLTADERREIDERIRRRKVANKTLSRELGNNTYAGQQARAYVQINRAEYDQYIKDNNLRDDENAMAKFVTSKMEESETDKAKGEQFEKDMQAAAQVVNESGRMESLVLHNKGKLSEFAAADALRGTKYQTMFGAAEVLTTSNLMYEINSGSVKGRMVANFAKLNRDEFEKFKEQGGDKYKGNEHLAMVEFYKEKYGKTAPVSLQSYAKQAQEKLRSGLSVSDKLDSKDANEFAAYCKSKGIQADPNNAESVKAFYSAKNNSMSKVGAEVQALVNSGDTTMINEIVSAKDAEYQKFKKGYTNKNASEAEIRKAFASENGWNYVQSQFGDRKSRIGLTDRVNKEFDAKKEAETSTMTKQLTAILQTTSEKDDGVGLDARNFAQVNKDGAEGYDNYKKQYKLSHAGASEEEIMASFYVQKNGANIDRDALNTGVKNNGVIMTQALTALQAGNNEFSTQVNERVKTSGKDYEAFKQQYKAAEGKERASEDEVKAAFFIKQNGLNSAKAQLKPIMDDLQNADIARSHGSSKSIMDVFRERNLTITPGANGNTPVSDIDIMLSRKRRGIATAEELALIEENHDKVINALNSDGGDQIAQAFAGMNKTSPEAQKAADAMIKAFEGENYEKNLKLSAEDEQLFQSMGLTKEQVLINYHKAVLSGNLNKDETDNKVIAKAIVDASLNAETTQAAINEINTSNDTKSRNAAVAALKAQYDSKDSGLQDQIIAAAESSSAILLSPDENNKLVREEVRQDSGATAQIKKDILMSKLKSRDKADKEEVRKLLGVENMLKAYNKLNGMSEEELNNLAVNIDDNDIDTYLAKNPDKKSEFGSKVGQLSYSDATARLSGAVAFGRDIIDAKEAARKKGVADKGKKNNKSVVEKVVTKDLYEAALADPNTVADNNDKLMFAMNDSKFKNSDMYKKLAEGFENNDMDIKTASYADIVTFIKKHPEQGYSVKDFSKALRTYDDDAKQLKVLGLSVNPDGEFENMSGKQRAKLRQSKLGEFNKLKEMSEDDRLARFRALNADAVAKKVKVANNSSKYDQKIYEALDNHIDYTKGSNSALLEKVVSKNMYEAALAGQTADDNDKLSFAMADSDFVNTDMYKKLEKGFEKDKKDIRTASYKDIVDFINKNPGQGYDINEFNNALNRYDDDAKQLRTLGLSADQNSKYGKMNDKQKAKLRQSNIIEFKKLRGMSEEDRIARFKSINAEAVAAEVKVGKDTGKYNDDMYDALGGKIHEDNDLEKAAKRTKLLGGVEVAEKSKVNLARTDARLAKDLATDEFMEAAKDNAVFKKRFTDKYGKDLSNATPEEISSFYKELSKSTDSKDKNVIKAVQRDYFKSNKTLAAAKENEKFQDYLREKYKDPDIDIKNATEADLMDFAATDPDEMNRIVASQVSDKKALKVYEKHSSGMQSNFATHKFKAAQILHDNKDIFAQAIADNADFRAQYEKEHGVGSFDKIKGNSKALIKALEKSSDNKLKNRIRDEALDRIAEKQDISGDLIETSQERSANDIIGLDKQFEATFKKDKNGKKVAVSDEAATAVLRAYAGYDGTKDDETIVKSLIAEGKIKDTADNRKDYTKTLNKYLNENIRSQITTEQSNDKLFEAIKSAATGAGATDESKYAYARAREAYNNVTVKEQQKKDIFNAYVAGGNYSSDVVKQLYGAYAVNKKVDPNDKDKDNAKITDKDIVEQLKVEGKITEQDITNNHNNYTNVLNQYFSAHANEVMGEINKNKESDAFKKAQDKLFEITNISNNRQDVRSVINSIRNDTTEMDKIRYAKQVATGDTSGDIVVPSNPIQVQATNKVLDRVLANRQNTRRGMSMDEILSKYEEDMERTAVIDSAYKAEASLISAEQEKDHMASSDSSKSRAKKLVERILNGSDNYDEQDEKFDTKRRQMIIEELHKEGKQGTDDEISRFMDENAEGMTRIESKIKKEFNDQKLIRMAMGLDGLNQAKANAVRENNSAFQKIAREFKKTHNGIDFNSLDITEQNAYLAKKFDNDPSISSRTTENINKEFLKTLADSNVIDQKSRDIIEKDFNNSNFTSIDDYLASGQADKYLNAGHRMMDIQEMKFRNDGSLEQAAIRNMSNDVYTSLRNKITSDKTDAASDIFEEEKHAIVEDKVNERHAEGKMSPVSVLPDVEKMTERQRLEFQANQIMLSNEVREGTNPDILKNILSNTNLVNQEQILKDLAKANKLELSKFYKAGTTDVDKDKLLNAIGSENINKFFNENYQMKDTLLSIGANDLLLTVDKDQRQLHEINALNKNSNLRNEVLLRQFTSENNKDNQDAKIKDFVRSSVKLSGAERKDIERDVKNDVRKQIAEELRKLNPKMSDSEINKKINKEGIDNIISKDKRVSDTDLISKVMTDAEKRAIELKVRKDNNTSSKEEQDKLVAAAINFEANTRLAEKLGKDVSRFKKKDLERGINTTALGLSKVEMSAALEKQNTIVERKVAQEYGNYNGVSNSDIASVYNKSDLVISAKQKQQIEKEVRNDKNNIGKDEASIQAIIRARIDQAAAAEKSSLSPEQLQQRVNKNLAESLGADVSDIKGDSMTKEQLNAHIVSKDRIKEIQREVTSENVGKSSQEIQDLINARVEAEANERIASKLNIKGVGLSSVSASANDASIISKANVNRNAMLLKVANAEYANKDGTIKNASRAKIAQTVEKMRNSGKPVQFNKNLYNQVIKNISYSSTMTDDELKAFLEAQDIAKTSNLGVKQGAKNVKTAIGQFFATSAKNVGTGVTQGIPHAFKNVLFKITKKAPQNSAYYDNWNSTIQQQITEVKQGKGAYQGLTAEERSAKVKELQKKIIYTRGTLPSDYKNMSETQKLEFSKNQAKLKHEAFTTSNPNYIRRKLKLDGQKRTGNKSIIDNFGATLHVQGKGVSQNIKDQHKKDLSLIKASISEYNSTKGHLDFHGSFEQIAKKYLGHGRALNNVLGKVDQNTSIAEKQKLLEEAMAKRYKIASHRVAHDSGVKRKDFLEERGIGETVVRYKDASKKYTALKSKINTHIPIPGLNAAINGISYKVKKSIVDRYDRQSNTGEGKVGRATRFMYDRIYGRKTEQGMVAAQSRKEILEIDLKRIEEFNRTFKGTAKEYSTQIKQQLGPNATKIYNKTFKLFNETSAVSIQQRGVVKSMLAMIEQENKRLRYTSNIIPASKDSAAQYVGKNFTNGKSEARLKIDKIAAENYNKGLNLIMNQRNVASFNSVYNRLLPQLKEQFEKKYNLQMMSSLSDSDKFDTLQNFLKKQLEKANRKVNKRESILETGKGNLEKLNGLYFKKDEIKHERISGTMTDAIIKSDAKYKQIVEQYEQANGRYLAETQHKSNLNAELSRLRNTPSNSYTKKEMQRVYQQIVESNTRIQVLKSSMEKAKKNKETYELSFAEKRDIAMKAANSSLAINSKASAFNTHNFYKEVTGADGNPSYVQINPNSVDGKQVDMMTRKYMTQFNSYLELMRRSDFMDEMLRQHIEQISRELNGTFSNSMYWSRRLDRIMFKKQKDLINENDMQERDIKKNKTMSQMNAIQNRQDNANFRKAEKEIEIMRQRLSKITEEFKSSMREQGIRMEEKISEQSDKTDEKVSKMKSDTKRKNDLLVEDFRNAQRTGNFDTDVITDHLKQDE